MNETHRYDYYFGDPDADYIVYESFDINTLEWIEHTRWMIPGTTVKESA